MRVRLYSKPGCSLCAETREMLERVRERIPFEFLEEDIRADPALFTRFRYSIPVVIIGGHDTFLHPVKEAEVEACLRRVTGGTPVADSGGHGK